jgi:predicted phage terminase large subunit-like protein
LTRGKFRLYPHIAFVARQISNAIIKGNARIIVECPPRHGKSWLLSKWTPAWFLSLFGDKNVMLTSYEADFASQWGRAVRNLCDEYPQLGVQVSTDSNAADRWHTQKGGAMYTAGVGGPITGKGAHLMIIDDYCKNSEQADSETYRKKTVEWFKTTFYTRAEPGASIIILATRWHAADLIGWILSDDNENKHEWTRIRIPAVSETNDPLLRSEGQALCPERFDENALARIKLSIGSRAFNALYQQRPSAQEGNIFKREWWQWYQAIPGHFDIVIQSWDFAVKNKDENSYSVGIVMGRKGADIFVLDVIRGKVDFPAQCQMLRNLTNKWPQAHKKLVEDKGNGSPLIQTLNKTIQGMIPILPTADKVARANAVSPLVEAGNVYLPKSSLGFSWVSDFIEELSGFPHTTFNDQVDAFTQGLNDLRSRGPARAPISGHSDIVF